MKNYREMADSVFLRGRAMIQERKRRQRMLVTVLVPGCLTVLLTVGLVGGALMRSNSNEPLPDLTGTAANGATTWGGEVAEPGGMDTAEEHDSEAAAEEAPVPGEPVGPAEEPGAPDEDRPNRGDAQDSEDHGAMEPPAEAPDREPDDGESAEGDDEPDEEASTGEDDEPDGEESTGGDESEPDASTEEAVSGEEGPRGAPDKEPIGQGAVCPFD